MTIEAAQAAPAADAPAANLTPTEQAAVEVGQRGFSEAPPMAQAAPAAPAVPEGIPAKFVKDGVVDYVAMAASYGELERKLGAAPAAPDAPAADQTPAPVAADGKIAKPVEAAPADNPLTSLLSAAAADFGTSQAFSDGTAQALAEAGIPVEVQAIYIDGLKARAERDLSAIHGYVGGDQNYAALAQWAGSTLSDGELEAYNAALENPQMRENAVRGLYARFQSARPSEGRQVSPVNGVAGGDVYSSRDQLIADQKDPRYSSDPSFREGVMAKLQRSQAAGFRVQKERMFDTVYTHKR